MWINEHRRCFQRSVDPHNERSLSCLFFFLFFPSLFFFNYYYLAVRNNRAHQFFAFLSATQYRVSLSSVKYEKRSSVIVFDEATRINEIVSAKSIPILVFSFFSRSCFSFFDRASTKFSSLLFVTTSGFAGGLASFRLVPRVSRVSFYTINHTLL